MEASTPAEDKELKEQTAELLARHPRDKHQLIPTLQKVQKRLGYLPKVAIGQVACHLGMTEVQVYGVASFYNHFRFTPLGKHPIQMCMGTACHMVGGELVLKALERSLDVEVGGITEDRQFSLDRVACIGCCGLAPVMVVGDRIHPRMSATKVDEVLVNIKMEDQEASGTAAENPEAAVSE